MTEATCSVLKEINPFIKKEFSRKTSCTLLFHRDIFKYNGGLERSLIHGENIWDTMRPTFNGNILM